MSIPQVSHHVYVPAEPPPKKWDPPVRRRKVLLPAGRRSLLIEMHFFSIETSFKMAFSNRFSGRKGGGWRDGSRGDGRLRT